MTILRINGDEWRNAPSAKRLNFRGDSWHRECRAREELKQQLAEELRRPLIPAKERLREYGK